MLSPSLSRITNRIRSSITERSFQGIPLFRLPFRRKSVTHVSGTFCYLCLRPLTLSTQRTNSRGRKNPQTREPPATPNLIHATGDLLKEPLEVGLRVILDL